MERVDSANSVPPKQKHPDTKGKKNSKSPMHKNSFTYFQFMH